MVIVMDRREPNRIAEKLSAKGVEVYIGSLDVGDYVVGNVLVERKKGLDLHHSIVDGRVWDELYRMKNTDMKPCLAIVEPFKESDNVPDWVKVRSVTTEEYTSVVATAIVSFGVSVVTFDSDDEFVLFLKSLDGRLGGRSRKPVLKSKKSGKTIDDVKFDILTSVPGIGSRTATELLKRYSIADILNMPEHELDTVKVSGRSIGKQLRLLREVVSDGGLQKN